MHTSLIALFSSGGGFSASPDLMYFVLDSNAAGYAAHRAALLVYPNSSEVGSASHDATLKVIQASVTDAELDVDAGLAQCRSANFSNELCRDVFTSHADWLIRGQQLIGAASGTVWYVRQEKYPTPSAYGEGTGKTHYDAAASWNDTGVLGATFTRGDIIYACGCNWAFRDGEAFSAVNTSPAFPTGTGTAVTWRMDHPRDVGMNYAGFVDRTTTSNTWTRPDIPTYPRVWKATLDNLSGTGNGHFLLPIDASLSTTDIYDNHLFGEGGSQAGVEANVLTAWVNTGTSEMWVHMPDDTDPSHRIGRSNGFGWMPKMFDPTTAYQDIDLINCQVIGNGNFGQTKYPKARVHGGRYLYKTSFKAGGPIINGTEWGRSTDGFILWDTSDRPDPNTNEFIQLLINRHGSDASVWNEFCHFMEVDTAQEGIYNFESTGTGDNVSVSGAFFNHIGGIHPSIDAKFGNTVEVDDGDSHSLGNQNNNDCTYEYIYSRKAGSHFNIYSVTTTTVANDMENNILQDFVLEGSNVNYGAGAGHNGINFNGDGQVYARTNATGNYAGNIARRGVVADIVPDPSAPTFGSPPLIVDGYGAASILTEEVLFDNISFVRLSSNIGGQLNVDMAKGEGGASDVTNPSSGALADPLIKVTNCYHVDFDDRITMMRTTGWGLSPQSIVSVTNANPCVVEITGHGFPDIAQADVYIEPEVYFDNMVGMTELDGNQYKAVWIGANTFSLKNLAGAAIDSTAYGTFTSGECGRAHIGYVDLQNNVIQLKAGKTESDPLYRYKNTDFTLAALQSDTRQDIPGATSTVLETGTTIS